MSDLDKARDDLVQLLAVNQQWLLGDVSPILEKVLDKSLQQFKSAREAVKERIASKYPGAPCDHCGGDGGGHVTHPCEKCGRRRK